MSNEPWTTVRLLDWTVEYFTKHELPDARYDAEMLLGEALGMQRIMLYANFEAPIAQQDLARYRGMVKRRAAHEPVAYILGTRGFWTIDLKTDARALIPRADTEILVEHALARIPKDAGAEFKVADIGTGTGAIALSIAHDRPGITVMATDQSADALALARENAEALGLTDRVVFAQGDLCEALSGEWATQLDVIVSNPPYIATTEEDVMSKGVKEFEPMDALFAGEDGMDVHRRLVPQAHEALKSGGWLLCEIGYKQAARVRALFEEHGFSQVAVIKDYGQQDRVVLGQKP